MANLGQIGTNTNYRLGNINTPSYLNEDDIKAIESVDQGRSSAPKISNSTLGDYVRTVGMGIPGITSGLSEVAAQGAEALLPESYSKPVREAASYLQDNAAKATKRLGEKRSQRFQEEASQPLISPNKEGEDKPFYERFNKDATLNTIGSTVAESAPGIVAMGGMGGVLSKAMGSGKILSPILEKMGIGGVVAEHFPSLAKLADTAIPGAISLESKVNKMIAASVATRGGQVASEGLFSAGQNAADKRQEALSTPLEVYRNNPLFHDELAKQDTNLPLEQRELLARESLANQAADHVFSETFKSTAGIAALTGGGALGDLAASGKAPITSALHKTLLKEGLKEGLAQELPQSYNEQLISNIATKKFIDPNRDVMDGVVDAALKGGIAGGIMGGGVGGLSHLSKSDNQKIAEGKKVDSVVDMEGNEHKITTPQLNTLYNKALSLYSSQPDITSKGYINSLNNIKKSINKVLEVGEGKEVDPVKKEEAEFILQNIELGHSNLVKAKERMDAEDRQKEEAAKEVVKPEVEQFKAVESDSSTLTQENKEAPIRTWGDINAADISRYNSVAPTERVAPAQPDSSYYNNLKESLTPQEESQMSPEELRGLMEDTSSVEDNYPQVQEVSPRLWGSVEGEDTSRYNGGEVSYRSEANKGDEGYYSSLQNKLTPKVWGDINGSDTSRYNGEEPSVRSELSKGEDYYSNIKNVLTDQGIPENKVDAVLSKTKEENNWDKPIKEQKSDYQVKQDIFNTISKEYPNSPEELRNNLAEALVSMDYFESTLGKDSQFYKDAAANVTKCFSEVVSKKYSPPVPQIQENKVEPSTQSQEAMKTSILSHVENINRVASTPVEKRKLTPEESLELGELEDILKEMSRDPMRDEDEYEALKERKKELVAIKNSTTKPVKSQIDNSEMTGWEDDDGDLHELSFEVEDGSEFKDESLTSLNPGSATLKVLNAIHKDQKAKNKYMFVKAKMKELNVSQGEQKVLDEVLDTLGKDGKWDWDLFEAMVRTSIAPAHLNFEENKQMFADHGLNMLFPTSEDSTVGWMGKYELHLTDNQGEVLSFPSVEKLNQHDLTDKAIAHMRAFEKDGIFHLVEVQSDVKQAPKDFHKFLGNREHLHEVSKNFTLKAVNFRNELADMHYLQTELDAYKEEDKDSDEYYNAYNKLQDAYKELLGKIKTEDKFDLGEADLEPNFDYEVSYDEMRQYLSDLTSHYNYYKNQKESHETTVQSYANPDYKLLEPYIEKRAIREVVKYMVNYGVPNQTFRLATPETIADVEGWDLDNASHKSLFRKYSDLSKAMAKELGMERVEDRFGNSWYQFKLPDQYSPLAYDRVYDSAGYLIKQGVDHKANKAAFNIFVNNLKGHIKNNERIEFHYIEDFDSHKFPESVMKASNQDAFRGTRAFVYRSAFTTKFYFNGSKFKSPEDLAGTFMHEVVGHYGVRELFGKEGYDAFLFRMIRTYPAFRKEAIAISKRWSVYLEDWKKDQGFSNLTGDEIQAYLKTLPSNQVQTFDDVLFPNSVALRVADEYVAELAKAKYFSKEFMKEKVGLNKEDRTLLSAQRERWLDQFILKIRNLLKKVFGNHLDKVSEDDVLNAIAQSFDNTFESINPQFFLISTKPGASITTIPLETTNQSPVTPKLRTTLKKTFKVEKGVISREEEEVSDQLEDNEIINHTLAPAVADLTTFIELQNSDSFEHAKTIRSKFWNDINDAFDNSILAPFKALGNMSYQRAYVAIQNIFKGKIAVMEDSVKGMSSVLNSLNSIQNQAVFEYMTTPHATLDGVPLTKLQKETVLKAKEAINAIGESLYQMGNISRESYEKNKDAYLHTVYMKYVDEYRGSAKRTSILSWMKKKKNLSERERLALGQIRDVKFLIPETIGVIARDHILLNMFDTLNRASISNDLHWVLTTTDKIKLPGSSKKVPIDKAYDELERRKFIVDYWESKNKHTFGGVGDKSNKRIDQLKLDIQSIEQQIKDLEDSVLENAFKHAQSTGKTKTESRDDYLKENYMRLPNRPHFGSLRNAYARKEIYNDLDAMTSAYNLQDKNVVEKFFASGGTLERINRFWKMSKVALNPGSWVRNTLGNFSLLDLSTSTPSIKLVGMLHQEISQALGKGESEYWKLANEYGLFGTTFAAVELQDIYSKYGDDLKRAQAEFEKRGGTPWDAHLPFLDERFMAFMRMAGHRIDNSTGKAFALVEGTFKTVAFRDYIEIWEKQNKEQYPQGWRGLWDDEKKVLFTKAASHANDSLFDYSQVNSVVKTLRRIPLGSPFLTFAYKAGPIAVKSMVNHPIKFAKYATLPALVTMISAFANDWDDKDISRFKRSLPDYYRTNPGVAFLPFKDSLGRVQILPLDYFIPWAQWASAGRKVYENFVEDQGVSPVSTTLRSAGTFANEFGFLGGPVPTGIAAMLTGKDEFTGKDILTPGASGDTHLRESMLYAYDQLTPTWLSSHGWFVKMYQAFGERPSVNRFGDIKYTPGQAVSDITGFRPTGIDERAGLENRKFGFEMKLKELATLRTKIIKDRNNMDKISELKDINFREKLLRQRMKEELSIK